MLLWRRSMHSLERYTKEAPESRCTDTAVAFLGVERIAFIKYYIPRSFLALVLFMALSLKYSVEPPGWKAWMTFSLRSVPLSNMMSRK